MTEEEQKEALSIAQQIRTKVAELNDLVEVSRNKDIKVLYKLIDTDTYTRIRCRVVQDL